MNTERTKFSGSYSFADGKLTPDAGMAEIEIRLKGMKMLAGSTETGSGEFYCDETDGSFWHYVQSETYETTLEKVDRSYIEKSFPQVDCDTLLTVGR